ncbi:erythromycin esterase family protein [Weeksellaceae bacterium KMM 9713]|uniref:Erythromycin esterase family protein n=1 Tax=Profundicola chukchiensis TaxID=2961959 RepID=A0A9X4N2S8_9FLAO|nr:erythromycin esterase family protein [Profundicola chukchiensis]MDG4945864.1 erythromycin esterase family protein [Profundicola chukchiensis]
MRKIIIPILLLITYFINAQSFTKITDSEFKNATFESLNYLKDDLKDVKLIGLGEALHNMGGTYTAKIKMVKFLHEKCGFNVFAVESPMYNLSKVNEQLKNGTATKDTIARNISGVWSTTEMMELFEYIAETQKTENPLEYVGFDESFFPSEKNQNLPKDYEVFISRLENKTNENLKLDSIFYNAIDKTANKSYSFSKQTPQDTLLMFNKFKEINKLLKKIEYKNDNYFHFWKLNTDNLQSVYRKNYDKSNRDKQMAINTIFLAENMFPNEKIIVWGATTHLIANINEIDSYKNSNKYNKNKLGVYLKNHFKEKYYLIAFTPMQGKSGFKGYLGLGKVKVRSKKGSIEYYINENYKTNFAYVPLNNEKVKKEIKENELKKSNILWLNGGKYNGESMNISKAVDAIFYLKNEHLINQK